MMKSRRKALKSLTQEKVVNIADYRTIRNGRSLRKVAVVTNDQNLITELTAHLQNQAEIVGFDSRFSLEQGLKQGEWDGVLLDERLLQDDALTLCEKVKKQNKFEDLFVVIISDNSSKDLVRVSYEKGCDEWITRVDDANHLSRLLVHHLS